MGYNQVIVILDYFFMIRIIAEIGSVHDGSLGNAINLIKEVGRCGAWGVKFQHHIASEETTRDAPSPSYFNAEGRYKYFERTHFSRAEWNNLYSESNANGLKFIVSPFSIASLREIIETGVDYIKIASGEITNIPLLTEARRAGKKVIMSSGMSSINELEQAAKALGESLEVLMQCTSEYPCKPQNVGLNNVARLSKIGKCKRGFSDHTMGNVASILSLAYGAEYIEKHVTFSRRMYGSDAKHSMEIDEFIVFIEQLNEAYQIINSSVDKNEMCESLNEMKKTFEKSIVYKKDCDKGHILLESDLGLKKPGGGIEPSSLKSVIGKTLLRSVKYDNKVSSQDLALE